MPTEILATPRAEQQIGELSRKHSKVFENFLNDLATGGCRALAYRLSGQAPVDHLCVKHLSGSLRVVVAFETPQRAWILLVGPHNDHDPVLNVCAELYRLLGAGPPLRSGPACLAWRAAYLVASGLRQDYRAGLSVAVILAEPVLGAHAERALASPWVRLARPGPPLRPVAA